MLKDLLINVKGCQFAHVVLKTKVGVPKKLGLGVVEKVFVGKVQLNYSYENAVNNRLKKEGLKGDFDALSLPWGNGKYLIRLFPTMVNNICAITLLGVTMKTISQKLVSL